MSVNKVLLMLALGLALVAPSCKKVETPRSSTNDPTTSHQVSQVEVADRVGGYFGTLTRIEDKERGVFCYVYIAARESALSCTPNNSWATQ